MNVLRRQLAAHVDREPTDYDDETRQVFERFLGAVTSGELRAANRSDTGEWTADALVKKGILLGFRLGTWAHLGTGAAQLEYSDKDCFALRPLPLKERNIRIVPGGSSVRAGAFVGRNVTMMPPAFVNVGAYVGDDTMVDSHALVGSCAQIGRRCHLSAGAQIGGVLEPIGQVPVVIEDDVFVGGNSGVYEGTIVRRGAVLAAGTILTRGTRVFDLVEERTLRASGDASLVIPENAVVIPGSRPLAGAYAHENGLHIYTPLIVKYRDEGTAASTTLEEALR